MPYLTMQHKEAAGKTLEEAQKVLLSPGMLNYIITSLCIMYINRKKDSHYTDYNDVIGALECAKLEFYRRAASAYEDQKINENGDVYSK